MISVTAQGTAEVQARLAEMRADLADKAIYQGLVYGAIPLRDAMRQFAPYKTGALRQSIGMRKANIRQKRRLGIGPRQQALIVGPRTVQGRAANILEGGAKPHIILPRAARALLFAGVAVKKVEHPGIKPRLFMQRAQETAGPLVADRFMEGVARYLDKQDRAAARAVES